MVNAKTAVKLWNNLKFWNIPNANYSRIIPEIIPEIWNNLNYSKIFELFQTAKNSGLQVRSNYSTNYSSRACARAINTRARIYMEKIYTLKGIYIFSNVNRSGMIELFQKLAAKNCDAAPLSPSGRLAAIFPQGKRSAMKEMDKEQIQIAEESEK